MDLVAFGERLRALRSRAGLKQAQIADRLGVSAQTVSKWECGLSAPDLDNLIALSDLLCVRVDDLLRAEAPEKLLVAIDGGGTKTEFIAFTPDGHILRHALCGGSNPNAVGADAARSVMTDELTRLLHGLEPTAVFAGVAGCLTPGNADLLAEAIRSIAPNADVHMGSDILNVIHSVPGADRCVAAICGTGCSVFSWDGRNLSKFGGWGYLFDGAGSGYDIGCDVLRECFAYNDGFGPHSLVVQLAEEKIGGPALDRLNEFYSGGRDRIAAFAPIAIEAFRAGDKTAAAILERNISRLASLIRAADNASGMVILSGGLTSAADVIVPLLASMLPANMRIRIPSHPQVFGAMRAAMKRCQTPIADEAAFSDAFSADYYAIRKEH